MEATTWLDRQQEHEADGYPAGAGAALPLILWAVVLIGTGGATALREVPLWAYVLTVASPAILLVLALTVRSAAATLGARTPRRRPC